MFRWANIDQMSMFISNLQVMILKKHAGKKIPQKDHYDITFSSDPGFVPPPSKTGWLVVNKKLRFNKTSFYKSIHIHNEQIFKVSMYGSFTSLCSSKLLALRVMRTRTSTIHRTLGRRHGGR